MVVISLGCFKSPAVHILRVLSWGFRLVFDSRWLAVGKRIYGSGLWRSLLFLVMPCSPFWVYFVAWSVSISPLSKPSILPQSVLHAADEVECNFLSFVNFWLGLWSCLKAFSGCGAGGFSLQWLLLWSTGRVCPGSKPVARRLRCLQRVESSWTRDWTGVPCIGRQVLNHWTTREVRSGV